MSGILSSSGDTKTAPIGPAVNRVTPPCAQAKLVVLLDSGDCPGQVTIAAGFVSSREGRS